MLEFTQFLGGQRFKVYRGSLKLSTSEQSVPFYVYAYKPCIGSVGHPKICVHISMIVQINLEPLIASKVTPVTHLDEDVVRTGQEACGTRTREHLELEKAA